MLTKEDLLVEITNITQLLCMCYHTLRHSPAVSRQIWFKLDVGILDEPFAIIAPPLQWHKLWQWLLVILTTQLFTRFHVPLVGHISEIVCLVSSVVFRLAMMFGHAVAELGWPVDKSLTRFLPHTGVCCCSIFGVWPGCHCSCRNPANNCDAMLVDNYIIICAWGWRYREWSHIEAINWKDANHFGMILEILPRFLSTPGKHLRLFRMYELFRYAVLASITAWEAIRTFKQ